jgi:membrane-associated phospholipid phosphatase
MMVLLVAGAAGGASLLLAAATRLARVQQFDDHVERVAGCHREIATPLARIGTLPGERYVHPAIGALTAATILLLRPEIAAVRILLPLAGASLGAIVAHHAIKYVYPRRRPASALARGKTEAAYPSGHTADATAVVLTSAWLLAHEGILALPVGFLIGWAIAAVTGASRVALGWHWATDVIGGWLTGVAVAACCVLLYGAL